MRPRTVPFHLPLLPHPLGKEEVAVGHRVLKFRQRKEKAPLFAAERTIALGLVCGGVRQGNPMLHLKMFQRVCDPGSFAPTKISSQSEQPMIIDPLS